MLNLNLKNKKVILTGGTRGIGLSILDKFYNLETNILVIGSNKENLEIIKKRYTNIVTLQLDLNNCSKI